MIVHVLNGIPNTPKVLLREIPVIIPGSAIGKIIKIVIELLPKKDVL